MFRYLLLIVALAAFVSCEKEPAKPVPPPPPSNPKMEYTDFGNRELKFQQVLPMDLDKDGTRDFFFNTEHVGDPLLSRDKKQFLMASEIHSLILGDTIVSASIYDKDQAINLQVAPGLEWNIVASVILVEKIIPVNGPEFWEGAWKDAEHKYLPVMILKGNQKFFGWIEFSVDMNGEQIILHKAAISKEANKTVRAGL